MKPGHQRENSRGYEAYRQYNSEKPMSPSVSSIMRETTETVKVSAPLHIKNSNYRQEESAPREFTLNQSR